MRKHTDMSTLQSQVVKIKKKIRNCGAAIELWEWRVWSIRMRQDAETDISSHFFPWLIY